MKQKDIALIIGVASVSLIIAIVLSNLIVGKGARNQQVEIAEPITSAFVQPSSAYFNDKSIDPTEIITIQDNSNTTPFDESQGQ